MVSMLIRRRHLKQKGTRTDLHKKELFENKKLTFNKRTHSVLNTDNITEAITKEFKKNIKKIKEYKI